MKRKLSALSERYVVALKKHLRQEPQGLQQARGLGRRAVALGLETLDMARIHERALAMLEASCSKDGIIERADIFFRETVTPIEETHRAALQAGARLKRLRQTLSQRTLDLAASGRSLKQRIAQRKASQASLKKSGEHYRTLVKESLALQKHLQLLTHRILSAQEDKRKRISHDLQDEIAQTLLGINVRLLTVKAEASRNAASLQKDIDSTQRLVDKSVKSVKRYARELCKEHEAHEA